MSCSSPSAPASSLAATRSPRSKANGRSPRRTMKQLELVSAVPNEETGELYCRYRVRR
nr:hypothetical protein [Tepidiforma sp.]